MGSSPSPYDGGAAGDDGAAPVQENQNWRAFDRSTEAGRMLAKLYGAKNKKKISYPKVRVDPKLRNAPRRTFCPGGGKVGVDARKGERVRVEVQAPYFPSQRGQKFDSTGRALPSYGHVDFVGA